MLTVYETFQKMTMSTSSPVSKRGLVVGPDPSPGVSIASHHVDYRIAHRAIHLPSCFDTIEERSVGSSC